MTQRFVAMLGCGSCHVRGCHESCSLRFASSDPQAVIVRHRPKRSHATTANADRLIAGCLITSAAPLRLLLSTSKYLPYLTRPRDCARCLLLTGALAATTPVPNRPAPLWRPAAHSANTSAPCRGVGPPGARNSVSRREW